MAAIANSFLILSPSIDSRSRRAARCNSGSNAATKSASYQSTKDDVLRRRYNPRVKCAASCKRIGISSRGACGIHGMFMCGAIAVRAFTLCLNMEADVRRLGAHRCGSLIVRYLLEWLTFAATSWNSSPLRVTPGDSAARNAQRCGANPGMTHHCALGAVSWNVSPLCGRRRKVMSSPGIPHHPGTSHLSVNNIER